MRLRRRSKLYAAFIIGGAPANIDKALELVVDPYQHIQFIHGLNVFILYFCSYKKIEDIRHSFNTVLQNEVELIFIFPYNCDDSHFINERVAEALNTAVEEKVSFKDLDTLRDIMALHQTYANPTILGQQRLVPVPHKTEEQPVSDADIMRQLLDKMKETGYDSLSPTEKDFLTTYSNKLNKDKQKGKDNVD